MSSKVVPFLLPCVFLLAGCGGGGGGTSSIPLDGTVRQMQAGDQWEYTITGTASDGIETVAVTGTAEEVWSAQTVQTPGGATAHVQLSNMTLTIEGRSATFWSREYMSQDANGTLWEYGREDSDSGGVYWIVSPTSGKACVVPSPLALGSSWGDSITYSNFESEDSAFAVVKTETVRVPAGSFDTFKITGNGRVSGIPATITVWFAPQIGSFVQMRSVALFDDDGGDVTMDITLKLKSFSNSNPVTAHQTSGRATGVKSLKDFIRAAVEK